ncbi:prepilin-type N-terminal cleavage/methylation domain-containing protein [Stenotrophomonas sp. 24(2023)]|uniref:type II secretion system protein n=1 Tax=Stenotrophomonas sp. 24(2023) TaxID=3068324 RepID=UPI0027DEB059|nr:prepilin-type N-terminal cleavage/methylation domain-containing protein [Stenotrophomonas sp. 24(2023)]WMJ70180.1 prepilin-type N-terminal cleavage/methylation domain-containing protein [Stenotrophomonas sp. 24(2023)]
MRCGDGSGQRAQRGFTLIELLVVLGIIALLLTLSAPRLFSAQDRARDTVLADNLRSLRATIDAFHGDTGRYPQSLEELVQRQYLRALPMDPVTHSATTWITEQEAPDNTGSAGGDGSAIGGLDPGSVGPRFGASIPGSTLPQPAFATAPPPPPGICCVRSGAPGADHEGKPYASY